MSEVPDIEQGINEPIHVINGDGNPAPARFFPDPQFISLAVQALIVLSTLILLCQAGIGC